MISLWVLAILVIYSISVSYRMLIEVRLSRYHRDKLKAYYLARGYILKLIEAKQQQSAPAVSTLYFPYNGPGNDNKDVVSQDGKIQYWIIDEGGKLNVNIINGTTLFSGQSISHKDYFSALIDDISGDPALAVTLTDNLSYWIGSNKDQVIENDYRIKYNYSPRHAGIIDLSEILLIDGWKENEEVLYKKYSGDQNIIDNISIYSGSSNGIININSCSKAALATVLKAHRPQDATIDADGLAQRLIDFRAGGDGEIGEGKDDQYFGNVSPPPLISEGIVYDVNNIPQTLSLSPDESHLLSDLFTGNVLTTGSDILRFEVEADVRGIKQRISAIVDMPKGQILYWNEE